MHEVYRCSRARAFASLQLSGQFPVFSLFNRGYLTTHLNQQRVEAIPLQEECKITLSWLSYHPNSGISQFHVKGFSEITSEIVGKALHCLCIKGLIPFSAFYLNTLITMYAKFGSIANAYNVFDRMPQRNEASWNNMVSSFVKAGLYPRAFELFGEMRRAELGLNGFVISSLITACSRADNMLAQAFQMHGFVLKFGLLDDVFVGTSLLHFYGTYGWLAEAREIFQEMPYKNTVSWTALMVGCSDNGHHEEVIDTYRRMRQEGVGCNESTCTVVISSCGMLENDTLGLLVLAQVMKSGFESNLSVANSLVSMFDNFGNLEAAYYVFDHMKERDTISWNSIIAAYGHHRICEKALRCFSQMRSVHSEVNSITLSSLLLACDSFDNVKWGRGIHGLVTKLGLH